MSRVEPCPASTLPLTLTKLSVQVASFGTVTFPLIVVTVEPPPTVPVQVISARAADVPTSAAPRMASKINTLRIMIAPPHYSLRTRLHRAPHAARCLTSYFLQRKRVAAELLCHQPLRAVWCGRQQSLSLFLRVVTKLEFRVNCALRESLRCGVCKISAHKYLSR